MASLPGGQFTVSAARTVNAVVTPDGHHPPPPVFGDFNLEVVTSPHGMSHSLPHGYQGVALLADGANGQSINMLLGNYAVTVTGAGADTVRGGSGHDTITAGSGPVTIVGGHGPDLINGGNGSAVVYGGVGRDTINAGNGPETIHGGNGPDLINGGNGSALIYGGHGRDTINGGSGPETIHGGYGADLIHGGAGAAVIYGGHGPDTIYGGSGPETVYGGHGHDTIHAGSGSMLISEAHPGAHDLVYDFSQSNGDSLAFAGETQKSIQHVVATAQEHGGNTTLHMPDGSTITLVGVTHVDASFFSH